jgi:hypothetical protein
MRQRAAKRNRLAAAAGLAPALRRFAQGDNPV